MGLWHTVAQEVTGAWRSARYDLDRHRNRRHAVKLAAAPTLELPRAGRPPSTSPAGPLVEMPIAGARPRPSHDLYPRVVAHPTAPKPPVPILPTPPAFRPIPRVERTAESRHRGSRARRPVLAPAGVALLVAGGAAGTYLAVAGSLSALTADPPAPAVAMPAASPSMIETVVPSTPDRATERRSPRRPSPRPTPAGPPPITGGLEPGAGDLPADPTSGPILEGTPIESPSPTATPTPSTSASPSPSASASPSSVTSASASPLPSRSTYGDITPVPGAGA